MNRWAPYDLHRGSKPRRWAVGLAPPSAVRRFSGGSGETPHVVAREATHLPASYPEGRRRGSGKLPRVQVGRDADASRRQGVGKYLASVGSECGSDQTLHHVRVDSTRILLMHVRSNPTDGSKLDPDAFNRSTWSEDGPPTPSVVEMTG